MGEAGAASFIKASVAAGIGAMLLPSAATAAGLSISEAAMSIARRRSTWIFAIIAPCGLSAHVPRRTFLSNLLSTAIEAGIGRPTLFQAGTRRKQAAQRAPAPVARRCTDFSGFSARHHAPGAVTSVAVSGSWGFSAQDIGRRQMKENPRDAAGPRRRFGPAVGGVLSMRRPHYLGCLLQFQALTMHP